MNRYKFLNEGDEHLHTLDGKPLLGTSSVSSVLAKPLTWWAAGLAVAKFGWTHKGDAKKGWIVKQVRLEHASKIRKDISKLNDEEYLQLIDDAYAAHSKTLKDSAQAGTDLHALVEDYIKECIKAGKVLHTGPTEIQPFIEWAVVKVKRFLWSEMHCYSERLWVGGITDFGFEDVDGKYAIGDIKSSKEAYMSQFWQCAGYDIQISENGGFDRDGNKIFTLDKPISYYVIFPFGMSEPQAQYYHDVSGGREAYECELILYKKLNVQ